MRAPPTDPEIAVLADTDVLAEVVTLVLARAGYHVTDTAAVVVHAGADGVRIARRDRAPARFVPAPLWEHVLVPAVGAAVAAWTDDTAVAAK